MKPVGVDTRDEPPVAFLWYDRAIAPQSRRAWRDTAALGRAGTACTMFPGTPSSSRVSTPRWRGIDVEAITARVKADLEDLLGRCAARCLPASGRAALGLLCQAAPVSGSRRTLYGRGDDLGAGAGHSGPRSRRAVVCRGRGRGRDGGDAVRRPRRGRRHFASCRTGPPLTAGVGSAGRLIPPTDYHVLATRAPTGLGDPARLRRQSRWLPHLRAARRRPLPQSVRRSVPRVTPGRRLARRSSAATAARTLRRIASGVAAFAALLTYGILPVRGQGPSMQPTIRDGELLFVSRAVLRAARAAARRGRRRAPGRRRGRADQADPRPARRPADDRRRQVDGQRRADRRARTSSCASPGGWPSSSSAPDQYFVVGDNRGMPMEPHTHGHGRRRAADRSGGVVSRDHPGARAGLPALSWPRTSSGAGSPPRTKRPRARGRDGLAATLSSRAADPLAQVAALGQLRRRLAEDVVVTTASAAPRFAAATPSPACGSGARLGRCDADPCRSMWWS